MSATLIICILGAALLAWSFVAGWREARIKRRDAERLAQHIGGVMRRKRERLTDRADVRELRSEKRRTGNWEDH